MRTYSPQEGQLQRNAWDFTLFFPADHTPGPAGFQAGIGYFFEPQEYAVPVVSPNEELTSTVSAPRAAARFRIWTRASSKLSASQVWTEPSSLHPTTADDSRVRTTLSDLGATLAHPAVTAAAATPAIHRQDFFMCGEV